MTLLQNLIRKRISVNRLERRKVPIRVPEDEASMMKKNKLLLEKVMVDILCSWKEPKTKSIENLLRQVCDNE
jgi:hypothetical protein